MTGKGYIDEVKLRLDRNSVSMELNDPMILSFINKGRQNVQRMTMDLMPERWGKIYIPASPILATDIDASLAIVQGYGGVVNQIHTMNLPTDFLAPYTVFLTYTKDGVLYRSEARRMQRQEMYDANRNAWTVATPENPIYTVDRPTTTNRLLISGLITNNVSLFNIATNVKPEVWYLAAIDSLDRADTDAVIPYEFEELVILYAMLYCLQTVNDMMMKDSIQGEINTLETNYKTRYAVQLTRQSTLLPSKEGL